MSRITGGVPHPPNSTWMLKLSSCPHTSMATSALLSRSLDLLSTCLFETGTFCDPWTKFRSVAQQAEPASSCAPTQGAEQSVTSPDF